MNCAYCNQKYCKCGANDYISKKVARVPVIPIWGGNKATTADNEDPRKEELLRQIAEKGKKLTASLYIQAFGGIIMIAFLILGLTDLVGLDIAVPASYIGLFIFLLGFGLAMHYDDSEALP